MTAGLRREMLLLIGLVLALDALFVAVYFLVSVRNASDLTKVVFTAIWTLAILVVAVRSLSRIRSARLRRPLD